MAWPQNDDSVVSSSHPFCLNPPNQDNIFFAGLWVPNSDDATALPDDEAHLHTIKDTAPCTNPEMIDDIGPMAAFSLQALLDSSFKLIFGVTSKYVADDAPMHFCHLFSEGAWVVDHALMEIKDENSHHQSALNWLSHLSIVATIEWSALPIQRNVAGLHAALVALASIIDDTMDWLKKTELALQTLVRHNKIIVNTTQHCPDKAETSIKRLIEHNVANVADWRSSMAGWWPLNFGLRK